MKRYQLVTGPLAVIVLTLTACGSSTKTVSTDDFITQMNAICRTATRGINDLDASSKNYVNDVADLIQTGLDDLNKLKPPKALKADFDDFVSTVDDELTQTQKLGKAIKAGDTDGADAAATKLEKLSKDGDDLADSIGADKCAGVGAVDETATTDSTSPDTTSPDTTSPDTTSPDTTSPDTTSPDTTTPNTPLPIDTTDNTVTTPSSSGNDVIAGDASLGFQPIPGYTWGVLEDVPGTVTPSGDPVLGPILDAYYVGVMENATDGTAVYVYITVLSQTTAWTPAQLDAYYSFELVADGIDTVTPDLSLPARTKVGAVNGYDGGVFNIDGFGVSILAPTGTDILSLLDAFATAQSMGA